MVYFVSKSEPYTYPVYPEFLDAPSDNAFDGVTYEADPETLDLSAGEREALAMGRTAMGHGYRVIGDLAPKKLLWEGGDKQLPEVLLKNSYAVSSRFRDLVEQFESGVHQFFPVDIYKTRDGDPMATYFWINVCNRIDSVNSELSNLYWKENYEGKRGHWRPIEGKERRIVFSLDRIGGRHLWMDPYLATHEYFYVSSAFADAARAADFLGLNLTEKEEA